MEKGNKRFFVAVPKSGASRADLIRVARYISIAIGERITTADLPRLIFESQTEIQILNSYGNQCFEVHTKFFPHVRGLINYTSIRRKRNVHWANILGEHRGIIHMSLRVSNCRPTVARFTTRADCDAELLRLMEYYLDDERVEVCFRAHGVIVEEWVSLPTWHVVYD